MVKNTESLLLMDHLMLRYQALNPIPYPHPPVKNPRVHPPVKYLVRHEYKNTKRGKGVGYPPTGIFAKPYRGGRRNVARIVRRQTKKDRTVSDTVQVIQAAYERSGKAWPS